MKTKLSNKIWKEMMQNVCYDGKQSIDAKLELFLATLANKHKKHLHKLIIEDGVKEAFVHLKKISVLSIEGLHGGELGKYIVQFRNDHQSALAKKGINSYYAQIALKAGSNCIFEKNNSFHNFAVNFLTEVVNQILSEELANIIGSAQFPSINSIDRFIDETKKYFVKQLQGVKNFDQLEKVLTFYDKDPLNLLQTFIQSARRVQKGLIIKEKYLTRFFEEGKTAEVRSRPVSIRGKIYLCNPTTKEVMGEATLYDVKEVSKKDYAKHYNLHKSDDFDGYPINYLWMMKDIIKYKKPAPYQHKKGCVIWIDLKGIKDGEE